MKKRLIQTLLVDGTLEGIRLINAETTTFGVVVPRIKLAEAKTLEEASKSAIYFLISTDGNRAYIGKAANFYKRLRNHDQKKDWWDIAVAFISITNDLDLDNLESVAITRAQGGSVHVENAVSPHRRLTSRFVEHQLDNFLDDVELLLTSLGYNILATQNTNASDRWYLKYKNIAAEGEFRGSQFIVLAGSTVHTNSSDRFKTDFPKVRMERDTLIAQSTVTNGEVATLKENIAFRSVSMAAGFVTGKHANGWTSWKNAAGKTMDEVLRQNT